MWSWALVLTLVSACGRIGFDLGGDGDAAAGDDGGNIPHVTRSSLALADPGFVLQDFPLLVLLDDVRAARDLMRADDSDLRFYDATGHVLAHEIENPGAPSTVPLVVWVRVPELRGITTIDVAYGEPPAATSMQSVWSDSYLGVYHMRDPSDATVHHRNGTPSGGVIAAQGMIGGGLRFDGTTGVIVVPDDAGLELGTGFTISAWFDANSFAAASMFNALLSRNQGAAGVNDVWLGVRDAGPTCSIDLSTSSQLDASANSTSVSLHTWTHVAMSYNGGMAFMWVGGQHVSTLPLTGTTLHDAYPMLIGADRNAAGTGPPDSDFFDGVIDEVRIDQTPRITFWMAYEDLAMRDQVITYGPVTR